ncbi:hypothetical protein BGX21_004094, partial [Mortierella sp. AD011]
MESKLSWILKRTLFDVEAFVKQFDYDKKESAVHDIEELTTNKRLPQATRRAVQQSLEHWLAVDQGTFWEDQKKAVTAKKALQNAQTAIIGKASDLVPGTLDKVGEPEQKKVLYSVGMKTFSDSAWHTVVDAKVPRASTALQESTATSSAQPTTSLGQPLLSTSVSSETISTFDKSVNAPQ